MERSRPHADSTGNTFINSNLVQNGTSSFNRPWNGTLTETHTFGPNTVNTFLSSYGRSAPVFTPFVNNAGKPEIEFGDGTAYFGTDTILPQGRIQNTYENQDIVTHVIGRHTLKFGGEYDRVQANSFFDSNINGTLTFLTLQNFLQDHAVFLHAGFRQHGARQSHFERGQLYPGRLARAADLTINLGFREEYNFGRDRGRRHSFEPEHQPDHHAHRRRGHGTAGRVLVRWILTPRNRTIGCRVGFAWNPGNGKTVIRGGYGIAYDFIYLNPITNGRFLPPFYYGLTLPQGQVGVGANSVANILAGTSPFQAGG